MNQQKAPFETRPGQFVWSAQTWGNVQSHLAQSPVQGTWRGPCEVAERAGPVPMSPASGMGDARGKALLSISTGLWHLGLGLSTGAGMQQ